MLRRVATEPNTIETGARPALDVGGVFRKTFELIGNRPAPLLGAAAISQLPNVLLALAMIPFLVPFVERMQRDVLNGRNDPSVFLDHLFDNLALVVGFGAAFVVIAGFAYAVQLGSVLRVVVDAFRGEPSTLRSALLSGLRRAPSLFAYQIVSSVTCMGIGLGILTLFVLPAVLVPEGSELRRTLAALGVFAGMFAGALGAFLAWCMFSLGAGAIVAEELGPFAGLARGFRLARRAPLAIVLTWLAAAAVAILAFCLVGCASGIFSGMVQVMAGQTSSAIVGQLVQFLPQVAIYAGFHVVSGVLYGELSGLRPADDPNRIADVFR